jgi:hypothetical protein
MWMRAQKQTIDCDVEVDDGASKRIRGGGSSGRALKSRSGNLA